MTISITNTFKELKLRSKCALIPFIVVGAPDLLTTKEAIYTLAKKGADIIELGFPYSDPLADGPVIQSASSKALQNGVKLKHVLELTEDISQDLKIPFIAFIYYNLVLNHGVKNFIKNIARAGFKGLIVPDLPLEEVSELSNLCQSENIELVLLISPNSPTDRISVIAQKSQGCIYLVSSTGVTGAPLHLNQHIQDLVAIIKNHTLTPIILGFGISKASEIELIKSWGIDGIVIGSAFVNKLSQQSYPYNIDSLEAYCKQIINALW